MDAGRLNRKITIQQASTAQDAYGQPVVGFTTLATVWAAVEPLTGGLLFAAKQAQSQVTVKVTIRYLATVTTAMQVAYGSHVYAIDAIIDFESRHETMELMCKEYAA
jgi:SPP1 family predicted phage head-tail adaptor